MTDSPHPAIVSRNYARKTVTYGANVKLDYKVNNSWKIRERRQPKVRRHFVAMAICAVVTFAGYAKFSDSQTVEADTASWSIPGGAMAAYPVLEDSRSDNSTSSQHSITDSTRSIESRADHSEATNFQVAALTPSDSQQTSNSDDEGARSLADDAEYEILAEQPEPITPAELKTDWQKVSVKSGDSMALIFKRMGLSARQLYDIMQLGDVTQALKHLRPGQELLFDIDDSGEQAKLQALQYDPDNMHQLTVQRTDDGYEAELAEAELTTRVRAASATIDSSLFLAGQKVGMSDNLIMQLVAIYGWDIDFVLDIRKGDQFSVIFQETYREGKKIKDGPIIAAEFINRDRALRAVRYVHPDGKVEYYAKNGDNMRKAFIRTPLDVFRISSHFNPGRKHPVLNRIRAHQGTDYAAPTGTPVKATGDGRIIHIGRKGGYGNTIILQHGGRYSTLYGHLSRYARGMRHGSRVEQGQIIAYVGSTGLATGPHLHYEFRVNGMHKNPVTVDLPEAESIPDKLRADFQEEATPLLAELDKLDRYDGNLKVADHKISNSVRMALLGDADGDSTR